MHLNGIDVVIRDFKVALRKSNYYYAIMRLKAGAKLELEILLPVPCLGIQRDAVT